MRSTYKMIYDMASLPKQLRPEQLFKLWDMHGIVLWDSNNGGIKPAVTFVGDEDPEKEKVIVDLKGREIDFDVFEKEYLDKEIWEKELHKCVNSPIFYFKNYAATTLPITSDNISAFLKELGLDDLTLDTDSDSSQNKEKWEKQKEAMKKAMSFITIDHLKSLKTGRELIQEKYDLDVVVLEKKLESVVDLKNSEGKLILEKKRIANLVRFIAKHNLIPEQYSSYEFKKQNGRWDKAMLGQTPYYNLLQIVDDLQKVPSL